jgi:hypothetical protein
MKTCIDPAVRAAQLQFEPRVGALEFRQARNHHVVCHPHVHVHARAPAQPAGRWLEHRLHLVEVG